MKMLTVKPYTRAEMEELQRIKELPHGSKGLAIKRFAKAFKRTERAVSQKLYSKKLDTKLSSNISKTPEVQTPNKEICMDIKGLRVEGNKLYISI